MAMFNGINHLAMATGDMDKTTRFWRDLLGMRLVAGLGQPGYRHYFFQISATKRMPSRSLQKRVAGRSTCGR